MIILTIRTDNPEAEIGLYKDSQKLAYQTWQAHRQLAETIHHQLQQLLEKQFLRWPDMQGIVVYHGPGSFTGLRIGLSVANSLAYSLKVPIIGATNGNWQSIGIKALLGGKNQAIVMPDYGASVHITTPRK